MNHLLRLITAAAVTTAVIAAVAIFSAWPSHRTLPVGMALLKLSFSHGSERNCRDLTAAELADLPANMHRKSVCDRQRPPLYLELDIDGEIALRRSMPASGIAGDGPARIYERFVLNAGDHEVAVRMRDTLRLDGFDHVAQRHISLAPDQSFAIDFRPVEGGFTFN